MEEEEQERKNSSISRAWTFWIYFTLLVIFVVFSRRDTQKDIHDFIDTSEKSNRTDYISSCYVLTPKSNKDTYLYNAPNDVNKLKKVKTIVIPAKASVGNTLTEQKPNDDNKHSFYNEAISDSNVDFNNHITLSPNIDYPLNSQSTYLKVITLKDLYRYNPLGKSKSYFLAPVKYHQIAHHDDHTYTSRDFCYIKLSDYNLSFKSKYNISRSKETICLGYVNN